jgi:hypothetical protein
MTTRKRRRRRSSSQLIAARTLIDIKARKRAFLKEVGAILTDALGFNVKVSLAAPDRLAGLSPSQRKAARMTRSETRRQIADAFAPFTAEPE